jgi:hypothetical protein
MEDGSAAMDRLVRATKEKTAMEALNLSGTRKNLHQEAPGSTISTGGYPKHPRFSIRTAMRWQYSPAEQKSFLYCSHGSILKIYCF